MGLLFLRGEMRDQGGPPQTPSTTGELPGRALRSHLSGTTRLICRAQLRDLIKMGERAGLKSIRPWWTTPPLEVASQQILASGSAYLQSQPGGPVWSAS